jgi:ElaB/YqjD/DUF883 family membrane-anchored ribosome-binding protein
LGPRASAALIYNLVAIASRRKEEAMSDAENAGGSRSASTGGPSAGDRFSTIEGAAGEKLREIVDASRDKLEALKRKSLEDVYRDARAYIRENPGKTLLGALAAGFLLGKILRRR